MLFKDLIKNRRSEIGLTLEEVGKIVGVSKATVQRWESGEIENVRRDKIALLAKALQTTPSYLMGWVVETAAPPKPPTKGIRINVLGKIAAGVPIEAVEEIIDWEEITLEMAASGKHFGLQIHGDSMEPRFAEGDVVIVRQQSDVDTGQVAVVMVNGHDATVKRIKKIPGGIMLIATNPKYDPKFYTNEEIETMPVVVLGRVVELRAKF